MCKFLIKMLVILCFAAPSVAQNDNSPRAEFFGGFSVLKTRYNVEQPLPAVVAFSPDKTLNGLNVSATGYIGRRFGITGDFSGHFTSETPLNSLGGQITTKIRVFNLLGGPQFKFRGNSRLSPFVRTLAGVANTRANLSVRLPSQNTDDTASSTDFAMALGGGLDVRVNKHVDLRLFQVDYNPVFLRRNNELGFAKSRADNLRYSFGVVFK